MDNGDPELPVLSIGQRIWWTEGSGAFCQYMVVCDGRVVSFDDDTMCIDIGNGGGASLRFIPRDTQWHETKEHAQASIDPKNTAD